MTTFANLRALASLPAARIMVERIELAALLEAFDKKQAKAGADLPDWLPLDAWNAFLDMRKKIKKPATDYAQKLLIKKLTAFHVNDLDAAEILNQSIMNGWQDLYAPKDQQGAVQARGGAISVQEQNRRNSEEARRLLGFRDLETQGSIL